MLGVFISTSIVLATTTSHIQHIKTYVGRGEGRGGRERCIAILRVGTTKQDHQAVGREGMYNVCFYL